MKNLILHRSSFIVLLLLLSAFQLFSLSAFAQNTDELIVKDTTLVPGTTYRFPSASTWFKLTDRDWAAQFEKLLICADSTAGFAAGCSLRVDIEYGSEITGLTTRQYRPAAADLSVFRDIVPTIVLDRCMARDTKWYGLRRHRFVVTVSDTLKLTLNRWFAR
jgi:hypothetical protein